MKLDEMSGWNKQAATTESAAVVDFTAAKSATKYLPAGAQWYDFWTEQRYDGGQDVTLTTTFNRVPMFLRAGSILPLAPVMQYASERRWDDLEVTVYPGADGQFTLYEDEGDSYNYEKGAYSTIDFRWNDRSQQLTIGACRGSFPRMLQQRTFRVRLAGTDITQTVIYNGKAVKCRF